MALQSSEKLPWKNINCPIHFKKMLTINVFTSISWCILDILNYFMADKKRKWSEAVYPQEMHFSKSMSGWHRKYRITWKLSPRALQNVTTDIKTTEDTLKLKTPARSFYVVVQYFNTTGTAYNHTKVTWKGLKLNSLVVWITAFIRILKICLLGKGMSVNLQNLSWTTSLINFEIYFF